MSDLICRKSMMRCQTPGMCSPHGGCQTSVLVDTNVRYAATTAVILGAQNLKKALDTADEARAEVSRLKSENERLQSAANTLSRMGYTDNGGELWKPPLGAKPDFNLIDQLHTEIERLQRFETAYKEFSDKTDWVRPNAAAHELGMHVADVIRKRCDDLTSHNHAQADEIKALRAASSPQHAGHIPGGAIADDVTGRRVIVSGDAINRLKASHPRACVNAGLCEKIGQRLYTRVFTELSACGTGVRP